WIGQSASRSRCGVVRSVLRIERRTSFSAATGNPPRQRRSRRGGLLAALATPPIGDSRAVREGQGAQAHSCGSEPWSGSPLRPPAFVGEAPVLEEDLREAGVYASRPDGGLVLPEDETTVLDPEQREDRG